MDCLTIDNEKYFRISNIDQLRSFFMSIVSDSNHWLFISSNGGLTAGRKNPEYALFPYYTDDKITESNELTGAKSIIRINNPDGYSIWEPFSNRFSNKYKITRNLYKSIYGNKIMFEEINHDLQLVFSTKWQSSNLYGFIKQSSIKNLSGNPVSVTLLDGVQNIMPFGVPSDLQSQSSNLVDAYKRSELIQESGLGVYALSAIIVDKAEPSEALKANIVWSKGFPKAGHLLSSLQLEHFRNGGALTAEMDVKGEKGAYFIFSDLELSEDDKKEWKIILNVNQNQSQVVALSHSILHDKELEQKIEEDIKTGTINLIKLNTASDGVQYTGDMLQDVRHFSNTLFNIMRGGIFDQDYLIEKSDLLPYLKNANTGVYEHHKNFLESLQEIIDYRWLKTKVGELGDADLTRLCTEYLPLKFSRRHGDPSRPWNKFSINTRSEIDGSKILDYQGNWRDIFQNWEALAHSYPEFMDGMIFKFLNASTFEGYNPYRVTKDGFDWETIEPDNPWSYIGYWGDHQVIYLLKFLEFSEDYFPGKLRALFDKEIFVYAAVPYVIKPFEEILKNSKDTILFDHAWDHRIRTSREKIGADGALLTSKQGTIYRVSFIEKILAMSLSKLSNLIPNGGIWMNTQRPEWNDANNALVGNGVSMVTLYYLRRFLTFLQSYLKELDANETHVSEELTLLYEELYKLFTEFKPIIARGINGKEQKDFIVRAGTAASIFRNQIYASGFSGNKKAIHINQLKDFIETCIYYADESIKANKRTDNLYHAYNLVTFFEDRLNISYLSEMLEGQVAVLSSGFLSAEEAAGLLDGLKNSALYRADQESYILYPNRSLPGFLEKNIIPKELAESSPLILKLMEDGNNQIVEKDIAGNYHFHGDFKNASDLAAGLDWISGRGYRELVEANRRNMLDIYEAVFNHKAFTGRSGTFFAFEGLGSIYWHMVSKLLVAVQECYMRSLSQQDSGENSKKLQTHFQAIKKGIGVHKSPAVYGAFPTDPYSHTPAHRGAQQPGMTGQVKEDILTRKNELGIHIKNGEIHLEPTQISEADFFKAPQDVDYYNLDGDLVSLKLNAGSLFLLYCQTPFVFEIAEKRKLTIVMKDDSIIELQSPLINKETSSKIFARSGEVKRIHYQFQLL